MECVHIIPEESAILARQWPGISWMLSLISVPTCNNPLVAFVTALKNNAWPLLCDDLLSNGLSTDVTLALLEGKFP